MANCPCCGQVLGQPPHYRLSVQIRRCHKPGCHCQHPGDPGHSPYLLLRWREHKKVKSLYLGKLQADELEAWERGELSERVLLERLAG